MCKTADIQVLYWKGTEDGDGGNGIFSWGWIGSTQQKTTIIIIDVVEAKEEHWPFFL